MLVMLRGRHAGSMSRCDEPEMDQACIPAGLPLAGTRWGDLELLTH
jgi:hypothetical protein